MPIAFVAVGLPGSGKSTVIRFLCSLTGGAWFNSDVLGKNFIKTLQHATADYIGVDRCNHTDEARQQLLQAIPTYTPIWLMCTIDKTIAIARAKARTDHPTLHGNTINIVVSKIAKTITGVTSGTTIIVDTTLTIPLMLQDVCTKLVIIGVLTTVPDMAIILDYVNRVPQPDLVFLVNNSS